MDLSTLTHSCNCEYWKHGTRCTCDLAERAINVLKSTNLSDSDFYNKIANNYNNYMQNLFSNSEVFKKGYERGKGDFAKAYGVLEEQNKALHEIKFARFSNEECWIYQGNGEDHLESLVCPVVISAEQLNHILKNRDADKARLEGYSAGWEACCEANAINNTDTPQSHEEKVLAEPTESYVQPVPDKCDRIIWRGFYYHLPIEYNTKSAMHPEVIVKEISKEISKEIVESITNDARQDVLNKIGAIFSVGTAARGEDIIIQNIKNAVRRSRCLSRIESLFTNKVVDDNGDLGDECLLNWGSNPEEYLEQFKAIYGLRETEIRSNEYENGRSAGYSAGYAAGKNGLSRIKNSNYYIALVEANNYGQFSRDFNQPLALLIRSNIQNLLSLIETYGDK